MKKTDEIVSLMAGYQTWTDAGSMTVESSSEAPAATTTFCAFTVSYAFTRATVQDGC